MCSERSARNITHRVGDFFVRQEELCENMSAKMVWIDNDDVNDFLLTQMNGRGFDEIWIAANDKAVANEWVWGPGDMVTNAVWGQWEPNNRWNEECVVLKPLWADVGCTRLSYPVCEVHFNISS
ncbi:CD209 antigen-like protein C isoform X2 [Pecten maximus]|uniref:CD209 antigen-like protein C isoform X2 n=1 Tax=Pecten maximus TaxID=6579 RepID=UPI00145912BC|nr:CD209 antigen-like protein C isoform X2 [Pecten maximus]